MMDGGKASPKLPEEPEIPEEDRRRMAEAAEAYKQRQRQAEAERQRQLATLTETTQRRIRELMGAESWAALRRFLRRERLSWRVLWHPPEGLTRDFNRANRARRTRANRFLEEHSVRAEQFQAIGREYIAEVETVLSPRDEQVGTGYFMGTHLKQWKDIFKDQWRDKAWTVFFPIDEMIQPGPHDWVTFKPPFPDGQMGWNESTAGDFRAARQHFLDPAAGLVGHEVTLDIDDASDLDMARGTAHTQIAFFFKPLAAGLVEVVIHAQSGQATHDLRTEDEWGWSDSKTEQENSLMMHVVHGNVAGPSFARMSHFLWETDDTETVHREFLTPGSNHFAQLVSGGPVPAGQFIEIRAGTQSRDWAITNDVALHSTSRFRWFIKAVHVRIKP